MKSLKAGILEADSLKDGRPEMTIGREKKKKKKVKPKESEPNDG